MDIAILNIVKTESLKMRHTFGKILSIIFPVFTLFLVYGLMGGRNFSAGVWNFWYTILLPAMLAVLCYLGMKKDEKINYYNMLVTPATPEKCFAGKMIYYSIGLFLSNFVIFIGTSVADILNGSTISLVGGICAAVLLSILYLWEIPLYMLLSYRFGMFVDIFVCFILSIGATAILANTNLWWLCPAAVPVRLMCPILGILPNGLLVPDGSSLYSTNVILPGIFVSLVWFVLMVYLVMHFFKGKAVEG